MFQTGCHTDLLLESIFLKEKKKKEQEKKCLDD